MALNDFLPYTAIGAGGGHVRIQWLQSGTSSPALPGEPVVVAADGQMDECGDDPASVAGIAIGVPVNGLSGATLNYPFVNGLNPDRAIAAGDPLPVVVATPEQTFITARALSDGSSFATTPALANIGDAASLDLISGNWGLRPGGGTNQICRILDVLDAQGRSINQPGGSAGTGVYTVFKFVSGTQL